MQMSYLTTIMVKITPCVGSLRSPVIPSHREIILKNRETFIVKKYEKRLLSYRRSNFEQIFFFQVHVYSSPLDIRVGETKKKIHNP